MSPEELSQEERRKKIKEIDREMKDRLTELKRLMQVEGLEESAEVADDILIGMNAINYSENAVIKRRSTKETLPQKSQGKNVSAADSKKLRRVLLVIPVRDILDYINFFDPGKIGSTIGWLVNNINTALTCKKEDLKHLRLGAIAMNEPKVIWVKMLVRNQDGNTEQPNLKKVDAVVHTYNKILEEILST